MTNKFLTACLLLACSTGFAAVTPPAAQRNCSVGGDLTINPGSPAQISTCSWLPNDDMNMQMTLHVAKEIDFISARCTFAPVSDSADKVTEVMGSKSGNSIGSAAPLPLPSAYRIIHGNDIQAIFRNFNNTFDDEAKTISHVNVLFYLDKPNYMPGDQITCTFAPL